MNDQNLENAWLGAVRQLIAKHNLPATYEDSVVQWLFPLAEDISLRCSAPKQGEGRAQLVVGVQGCQGSGKSTSTLFLKELLASCFGLNAAVLSIDDFYLGFEARQTLASEVHPLLRTRGVPGTHDVGLAIDTIHQLKALNENETLAVPTFDKAQDDRLPKSEWRVIAGPVDIVLLEGWFVGLDAQDAKALLDDTNELEALEDEKQTWRHYVNNKLAGEYQLLFCLLDYQVVLQAQSFNCVYKWRSKQEQQLISSQARNSSSGRDRTLGDEALKRFVAHYQRLTQHALRIMPAKSDWCLYLGGDQSITRVEKNLRALSGNAKPVSESVDNLPLKPLLVVTDLDGTLLDHYTYTHAPAFESIKKLKSYHIPIIFNSSKTFNEIVELQKRMNIVAPFVVENGSAMFVPKHYFLAKKLCRVANMDESLKDYYSITFGESREYILRVLSGLKSEFKFQGFSDWDVETLQENTGLSIDEAEKAGQREFSEPFLWQDSSDKLALFESRLLESNLSIKQGGRFYHVIGRTDKAKPILFLRRLYDYMLQSSNSPSEFNAFKLVCLGDSDNDRDMLEVADYPVCIRSPVHDFAVLNTSKNVIRTRFMGPTGWTEAIDAVLQELQ